MTFVFGSEWLQTCNHKTSQKYFFCVCFPSAVLISSTNLLWHYGHLRSVFLLSYLLCFCYKALLHNHSQALLNGDREWGSLELKMSHCTVSESSKHHYLPSPLPQLTYGVWAFISQSNQPSDLQIHQVAKNVS